MLKVHFQEKLNKFLVSFVEDDIPHFFNNVIIKVNK